MTESKRTGRKERQIEIRLGCVSLPAFSFTSNPNPLVALFVRNKGESQFQFVDCTERQKSTVDPRFERLLFLSESLLDEAELRFSCYDVKAHLILHEDERLGTSTLQFREFLEWTVLDKEIDVPLYNRKGKKMELSRLLMLSKFATRKPTAKASAVGSTGTKPAELARTPSSRQVKLETVAELPQAAASPAASSAGAGSASAGTGAAAAKASEDASRKHIEVSVTCKGLPATAPASSAEGKETVLLSPVCVAFVRSAQHGTFEYASQTDIARALDAVFGRRLKVPLGTDRSSDCDLRLTIYHATGKEVGKKDLVGYALCTLQGVVRAGSSGLTLALLGPSAAELTPPASITLTAHG